MKKTGKTCMTCMTIISGQIHKNMVSDARNKYEREGQEA